MSSQNEQMIQATVPYVVSAQPSSIRTNPQTPSTLPSIPQQSQPTLQTQPTQQSQSSNKSSNSISYASEENVTIIQNVSSIKWNHKDVQMIGSIKSFCKENEVIPTTKQSNKDNETKNKFQIEITIECKGEYDGNQRSNYIDMKQLQRI